MLYRNMDQYWALQKCFPAQMVNLCHLFSWPEKSSQSSKRYNGVVGHQERSLTRLSHLFNIYSEIIMCIAVDGCHSGINIGRRRCCNLKYADDILIAESVVSSTSNASGWSWCRLRHCGWQLTAALLDGNEQVEQVKKFFSSRKMEFATFSWQVKTKNFQWPIKCVE